MTRPVPAHNSANPWAAKEVKRRQNDFAANVPRPATAGARVTGPTNAHSFFATSGITDNSARNFPDIDVSPKRYFRGSNKGVVENLHAGVGNASSSFGFRNPSISPRPQRGVSPSAAANMQFSSSFSGGLHVPQTLNNDGLGSFDDAVLRFKQMAVHTDTF